MITTSTGALDRQHYRRNALYVICDGNAARTIFLQRHHFEPCIEVVVLVVRECGGEENGRCLTFGRAEQSAA
mgnify:CR=1 FL=1